MTPAEFKAARLKLGLSQAKIAVKLGGYHVQTVSAWECGRTAIPKAAAVLVARMLSDLVAARAPDKPGPKALA